MPSEDRQAKGSSASWMIERVDGKSAGRVQPDEGEEREDVGGCGAGKMARQDEGYTKRKEKKIGERKGEHSADRERPKRRR